MRNTRRFARRGVIPEVAILLATVAGVCAGPDRNQLVSSGDQLSQELAPGQRRLVPLSLGKNEYLRLAISSWGTPIAASLLGPTGSSITGVALIDENPTYLSLATTVEGKYAVQITAKDTGLKAARIDIRVDQRRPKNTTDPFKIAIERNCFEADDLQREFTPDAERRSLRKLEEALLLSNHIQDLDNVARICCKIGDLLLDRSRFSQALSYFEQSIRASRQANNLPGVADALARIGIVKVQNGEPAGALEPLERALKMSQEVGNLRSAALSFANIGEAHYWMGRQRQALGYYQQAAQLWRTIGERRGLATALYYLGSASMDLSEVRDAFGYFQEALNLWRAIGDRHGEALTVTQLGALYNIIGDTQEGISRYLHAARYFQLGGDLIGEGNVMDGLAFAYYGVGDLEPALDYYSKALRLFRKAQFRNGEAGQLMRIGEVYFHRGEYRTALKYVESSLAMYEQIQDRRMSTISFYNLGRVLRAMGDFDHAIERLNKALALARELDDIRIQAWALSELGSAFSATGAQEQAADCFMQALVLSGKGQDRFSEVQIGYNLARNCRQLGRGAEALDQIKKAIEIVESLRTKVDVPSLRVSYFSTIRRNYDLYIDLLMDAYAGRHTGSQDAIALQVSERSRARNLLDLLEETRAGIRQGINSPLSERQKELSRSLNSKAQRQTQLMSGPHSQEEADKLAAEIRELNTEYDQLQAEIRVQNPHYAELTQPRPLDLAQIQEQVLDDKTLLLEYSLGEEHSYLWAVTNAGMTSYELPEKSKIEGLARQVRELLAARQQSRTAESASQFHKRVLDADAAYWKSAAELSRILLGPAADKLGDCRLLVVADGLLQYLPFAALPDPATGSAPLIAEHEIVSLPSASTLGILRQEIQGRKPAEMSVAVFADPVYHRDDERINSSAASVAKAKPGVPRSTTPAGSAGLPADSTKFRGGSAYPRLLYSGTEARDILSNVAPGMGARWVGIEATRARATSKELSRYRIVHFATHGEVNDTHPDLSGIVLSMYDARGHEQDGFLRLLDIYNLNLPAELVVLSACNTGLGKDVRGEGFIGLVRGFLYAGAARVLASLWRVDDESTAELMKRFYRAMLKDGMAPAAALRAAQVEMWKHPRWSAPYYWAGFVLQGEYK